MLPVNCVFMLKSAALSKDIDQIQHAIDMVKILSPENFLQNEQYMRQRVFYHRLFIPLYSRRLSRFTTDFYLFLLQLLYLLLQTFCGVRTKILFRQYSSKKHPLTINTHAHSSSEAMRQTAAFLQCGIKFLKKKREKRKKQKKNIHLRTHFSAFPQCGIKFIVCSGVLQCVSEVFVQRYYADII